MFYMCLTLLHVLMQTPIPQFLFFRTYSTGCTTPDDFIVNTFHAVSRSVINVSVNNVETSTGIHCLCRSQMQCYL